MPFANYAQLQASITSYLENDDVTGQVADFIALAEARFNRELRVREMTRITSGTSIISRIIALPEDYIEAISWLLAFWSPNIEGEYLPPNRFFSSASASLSGKPRFYTITGNLVWWAPNPGTPAPGTYPYALIYYSKIPALTTTNTTNWLLAKAPDLYLYGALLEAQPFVMDDARVGVWQAFYDRALKSLHSADARARYRPGGVMRPESVPRDGKAWMI